MSRFLHEKVHVGKGFPIDRGKPLKYTEHNKRAFVMHKSAQSCESNVHRTQTLHTYMRKREKARSLKVGLGAAKEL